jgi:heptaprenyl diphosphate synthase
MRDQIARTPVAAPAEALLDAGGKRLRARLLWWAANAAAPARLAPDDTALVRAASAIEFAHLGSLVHDDIVDRADTRRGVPTVHRMHGIAVATEAGAALAHLATEMIATLGDHARRAVRRALLATCRGQVRELAVSFVVVSPRRRFAIMQEKTGAFFELAGALGSILGNGDAAARAALRRFARRFGVAFQISDDVLDLAGDPSELGRANGADLRDGVVTLPVLLAADTDHSLRRALAGLRNAPDARAIAECAAATTKGGGVAAASAVATWWLARAVESLSALRPSADVAALVTLARASVARGLCPGASTFVDVTAEPRPADTQNTPFIMESRDHAPSMVFDQRLVHVLEWFHPGLASMVAARAADPVVNTTRHRLRERLRTGQGWSPQGLIASDAVALAHALAQGDILEHDPVRTLAMVDALHCAAISFLTMTPTAREHEGLARRARHLLSPRPPGRTTALPVLPGDQVLAVASPA